MDNEVSSNPNTRYIEALQKDRLSLKRRIRSGIFAVVSRVRQAILSPIAWWLHRRGLQLMIVSHPNRIGHLASEPDWVIKQMRLGERPGARPVLLVARRHKQVNRSLLDLWSQQMDVVVGGWRYQVLRLFRDFKQLRIEGGDGLVAIEGAADYPRLLAAWGDKGPVVSLMESHIAAGQAALRALGVPPDAWFVCLHVREASYSPTDEYLHGHRNADIATYEAAAREIAARGGWVIRMGDAGMKPLPEGPNAWPNTVDYARSDAKSEAADIFLCARARFFLGTTSGLIMVATIFDVPSVLVNMIPHGAGLGMGPRDIAIQKLLADEQNRILHFSETLSSEIGHYRMKDLYERAGLQIIENTPEEIHAVTVEMLDRLDAKAAPETEQEAALQKRFRALFGPEHYCYHSGGTIGRAFLIAHADLLPNEETKS